MSRRWKTGRLAMFGAVAGAFLSLLLVFAAALGGYVTGLAFWGRILLGALAGALVVALVSGLRNRLARA